jgi:hypothetical protein
MNIEKILISLIGLGYSYSISKHVLDENNNHMNNKLRDTIQTNNIGLIRKEMQKQQEWNSKSVFYKIFIGPK